MVAPIRFLSGRQQQQKIGITSSTENEKVLEVIGRVGIGTTIFEPSVSLDVRGDTIVSGNFGISTLSPSANLDVNGTVKVSGISVFNNNVGIASADPQAKLDVNGTLNVSGVSTFNNNVGISTFNPTAKLDVNGTVRVSGASTFTANVDFESDVDIDGHTELDNLNVSGIATFNDIDIDGHTELDDLSVSGVSTFTGNIDANGSLDVDGHTELDDLSVSGVSTFTGNIDANGSLDVDGHTELDDLNVSGIATFNSRVDLVSTGNTATFTGPSNLVLDPAGIGDNTGKVIILGDLQVDGTQTIINSTVVEIDDKLISIAKSATSASEANGAGLEINGANATLTYAFTDDRWVFNKDVEAPFFYGDGSNLTNITAQQVGAVTGSDINTASGDIPYYISAVDVTSGISSDVYVKSNIVMTGIGSVGIGTTQPTYAFDVDGDVQLSGKIYDSSNSGGVSNQVLTSNGPGSDWSWKSIADVGAISGSLINTAAGGTPYYISALDATSGVSSEVYVKSDIVLKDGNIGIGTDDPQQLLHLASTNPRIRLDDNDSGGYYAELRQGGSATYLHLDGNNIGSGNFRITADGGNEIFRFNDKGNVSIAGSTSSFDINPTVNGLQLYYERDTQLATIASYDGTSGSEISIGTNDGTSDVVEAIRIKSDGNIGISSTQPTAKLDVNGTVNVSGVSTFTGAADFNGDVDIDGHTELDDVNVSGVSTFNSDVSFIGQSYGVFWDKSDSTLEFGDGARAAFGTGSDLIIQHNSSQSSISESSGNGLEIKSIQVTVTPNGSNEKMAEFNANSSVDLYYDDSKKFETTDYGVLVTGLNVSGISTLGTVEVSSGIITATTGIVTYYGDGQYLQNIASEALVSPTENTTNQSQFISFFAGTASTSIAGISTQKFVFNPSTTQMGIGVDNPEATLEINVGTAVTALDIQGSAGQLFSVTNNLTSGSIFSVNDVSGIPSIDVDADGTIQLAPYGVNEFIGVGKTNPQAKLDVNGDVLVSGSIGIGTTNPTAKLDVDGTLNVEGTSTFQSDVTFQQDATVGVGSVLKVATARHFGLVRSIGTNVGDWVGIGTIGTGNGAMNAEITVWEAGPGQSSAKKFFIHNNYDVGFDSNWYEVVPLYSSGPRGGAYALDIRQRELRLRRTATGFNYSAMQISIISNTGDFNAGVYSGTSGTVTNTYENTVLKQYNREVAVYGSVVADGALNIDSDVNVTGVSTFQDDVTISAGDKLLVGIATGRPVGSTSSQRGLQVEGTGVESAISIVRNINSAANPYLFLGKTRGTSTGDSTIVQSGDALGAVAWCGADGTDLQPIAAMIQGQVDGTPGVDDMPGRLVFMTTPDGSNAAVERVRISAGGTTVFTGDIDANGHTELDNLNVSGITTTSGLLDINAGGQANTFKVEDLTDNRVVIAGTSGELEDDANLTFNGTQFAIGVGGTTAFFDVSTGNIGIGSTQPLVALDVAGNIREELHTPAMPVGLNEDIGLNWTKVNIAGAGLAVNHIDSLAYCGDGIVLAGDGSTTGDIYRSTDYGLTFTQIELDAMTGEDYEFIFAIVYCGNGIVLAATGFQSGDGDILRSTDYGVTWSKSYDAGADIEYFVSLTYCGNGIVLAGSASGTGDGDVYRSTDFGLTFTKIEMGADLEQIRSLEYCGNGIALAGTGDGTGDGDIYRSADYGATWTKVYEGSGLNQIVAIEYCGNGIVLAGGGTGSNDGNVYRSTDYGLTYTLIELDTALETVSSLSYCDNGIVLAGGGSGTGDGDIFRSTDYGLTWTKVELEPPGSGLETIRSLLYLGNGIALAGSTIPGDIYRSEVGFSQATSLQGVYHEHLTGNIGIGTTTPTTKLHVIGEVTATDFNSTSDARLKTNVQVIEDPLEKVVQINGVSFNWIEDNKPSMGVIADNIQEVLPELVSDTDPKTVNYNGIIGLLIECVKKQQVEIENLKRRIE